MPNDEKYLYWDTCIFLSYLKQTEYRYPTLYALFAAIEQSHRTRKIVTSMLTRAEAAYIEFDEQRGFPEDDERKLDNIWANFDVIAFIEVSQEVTYIARHLMREAKQQGLKALKVADALHLASAQWMYQFSTSIVFHTYDTELAKYSALISFPICEPSIDQLPLLPA
jgi:predicted nucleic acid-binding protein